MLLNAGKQSIVKLLFLNSNKYELAYNKYKSINCIEQFTV